MRLPDTATSFRPTTGRWCGGADSLHFAAGLLCFALLLIGTGCVTTPSPNRARFGPYPEESETVIASAINSPASPQPGITRTVTSVTEPTMGTRDGIDGWLVWAKIREHRPNQAGGIDVKERDYYFLLQGNKIILTDYPLRQ